MDRKVVAVEFSPKSGKDLAKVEFAQSPEPTTAQEKPAESPERPAAGFGKGTAKYWEQKVYRPVWRDESGQRREVSHYFVRIMVSARREAIALNTADRLEAGRKASKLYERIRVVGWESALREFDPERHTPKSAVTIGDVIAAINRADLHERTRTNYVNALRWFAARHIGFEATKKTFGPEGSAAYRHQVEAVRLADLTDEAVQEIVGRHIGAAGEDANAGRSARIGAASFLRNAKAGLRATEGQGLSLPEPRPFAGVKKPEGTTAPPYTSTFDAGKLLRQAKKELAEDPPAYAAVLLALGAGLRRSEIKNLRWRRVDKSRKRILVLPTGGWAPKTEESEQAVRVSRGLISELEPFRAGPDDPVTTPAALDRAVYWLRQKGLDVNMPLHTMRKEFGSIICETEDLFTASKALRHKGIAVTASIYVENRKNAAPDIGAMLKRKKGRR